MRRPQYTVTAAAVQQRVRDLCQRYLDLEDHGPKCTAVMLVSLLLMKFDSQVRY